MRILYHIDSKLFYRQLMQSLPDITNRPSRRKQHLMGEISPQLPFLLSLLSVKMSLSAGKLKELQKNLHFIQEKYLCSFSPSNSDIWLWEYTISGVSAIKNQPSHQNSILKITNPSSEEKDESSGLKGNVIQDLHNSQQLTLSQEGTRALVHKSVKYK